MKRRLYFVLPDKRAAKEIKHGLLLARIEPSRIGFLAKSDINLGDLPSASPMQWSDLRRGIKLGLLSHGLAGAVVGLLLALFANLPIASSVLGMALLGAGFGVWVGGMGVRVPSRQLETFQQDIRDGQILLMIDVPRDQVEEVTQLVMRRMEVNPKTAISLKWAA